MDFDQTFQWLIDESIDPNGNKIEYLYTTFLDSPGQLYLDEIRHSYNGGSYQSVVFHYQTRSDVFDDFRSGFQIQTAKRVSRIQIKSLDKLVREYHLDYDLSEEEEVGVSSQGAISQEFSLLQKVTQYDSTGQNFLPPLRLEYTRLYTRDIDHAPVGNFPGPEDIDLNNNEKLDNSAVQKMNTETG